jgi:hypothetical protein
MLSSAASYNEATQAFSAFQGSHQRKFVTDKEIEGSFEEDNNHDHDNH